jgi:hypothetical protein
MTKDRLVQGLAGSCAVLALVAASAAVAQMGYVPPNFALMQSFIYHTTSIPTAAQLVPKPTGHAPVAPAESAPIVAPVDDRQTGALAYASTPEISRAVRLGLLERMRASGGEDAAGKLDAALAQGDMVGQFRGLLPRYGLSPDNFADVYAGYLLLSWEVVSGREPTAPQVRGTDLQVRAKLASSPVVRGWTDADKQRAAEELIYRAMLSTGWNRLFLKARDTEKLAALKQSVRRSVREMGMDFDRLRLTERGFERR